MHIELLQPHTHGGRRLAPGDRLTLDPDLAHWLMDIAVARAVTPASTTLPIFISIEPTTEEVSS